MSEDIEFGILQENELSEADLCHISEDVPGDNLGNNSDDVPGGVPE